jgi:Cyclophilin type peptidyl-prolyl cis-trans isomerase/CLD
MKLLRFLCALALVGFPASQPGNPASAQPVRKPGTYAIFDTSMGLFVCELFEKLTPVTVANFIGLTEGSKEWMTPKGDFVKKPYYDGVTFHRVIKGFAIQAGDVTRTGNFTAIPRFRTRLFRLSGSTGRVSWRWRTTDPIPTARSFSSPSRPHRI